jgi:hypothetical protein
LNKEWLVICRNDKASTIHAITVSADSMVVALQEARAREELANVTNVWACIQADQVDEALASMSKFVGRPAIGLTMHLRENEWTGYEAAVLGSARDHGLNAAHIAGTMISVDVKGKPLLMRVASRLVNGNVVTYELAEPRT